MLAAAVAAADLAANHRCSKSTLEREPEDPGAPAGVEMAAYPVARAGAEVAAYPVARAGAEVAAYPVDPAGAETAAYQVAQAGAETAAYQVAQAGAETAAYQVAQADPAGAEQMCSRWLWAEEEQVVPGDPGAQVAAAAVEGDRALAAPGQAAWTKWWW